QAAATPFGGLGGRSPRVGAEPPECRDRKSGVDLELGGRVVLVTGAGQGLGREIGLAFAREGAHVAFHYHSSGAGAEEAAAEAGRLTGKALAVQADIRADNDVATLVDTVESQLGPIGVLVNNAAATGAKP